MILEVRIISDEITPWLVQTQEKLSSDRFWTRALLPMMEHLQRYAAGISPVLTGSYAGSHQVSVSGRTVALGIDPTARNAVSGELVERYAGAVEELHQVYARTWEEAERMADEALENAAKELGFGN